MRTYETLFIVHPDLDESGITQTIETFQDIITTGGGKMLKVDKWGRRQLAYMIRKKLEGYYVVMYFEAPQTLISELNRRFKLAADKIMRSLVVQLRPGQIDELLESDSSVSASDSGTEEQSPQGDKDERGEYPEYEQQPVASTEE